MYARICVSSLTVGKRILEHYLNNQCLFNLQTSEQGVRQIKVDSLYFMIGYIKNYSHRREIMLYRPEKTDFSARRKKRRILYVEYCRKDDLYSKLMSTLDRGTYCITKINNLY